MQLALEELVRAALAEDIGHADLTTVATVPPEARCQARLIAKQDGVLSGMRPFRLAFDLAAADIHGWHGLGDSDRVAPGVEVARFSGCTRAVLSAERTALNFLQHLSGVATLTAAYLSAIDGLACRISDTRKTTPLLRQLEKEAVRPGLHPRLDHQRTHGEGVLADLLECEIELRHDA